MVGLVGLEVFGPEVVGPGVVDPNTEVSILLIAELDPAEENKHKFMVQSMFAPETGEINQDTLVSGHYVTDYGGTWTDVF